MSTSDAIAAPQNLVAAHLQEQKFKPNLVAMMQFAKAETGKSEIAQAKEVFRLRRGDGMISFDEYYLYRLYDDRLYTPETRAMFLSEHTHWPLCEKCADLRWRATTEDKWLAYTLLEEFGQRVPRTLAVVDRSQRNFAKTRKLTSAAELAAFLESAALPIFAKPNGELGSFGAFVIERFADGQVQIDQNRRMSSEELFAKVLGERTYLLQEVVRNHPDIAAFAKFVPTIRTMNLVWPDRVDVPFTIVKIPVGDNIADNYWRKGNLIADIDPASGEIRRVVSGKGATFRLHETHPETGQRLIGFKIPMWHDVLEANLACARAFAPVRYQSLDIAVTPDGPSIIEINSGGSFMLPQIASGRGFLTPEVRRFFEHCGWKFKQR
ncbi:MAG: sugar-transfer associated ATP-grasp domain-containing protein [Dongiaceae bacterium]